MGQGQDPSPDASELWALKQHFIRNRQDSVMNITTWAKEHIWKSLSENTVLGLNESQIEIDFLESKDTTSFGLKARRATLTCCWHLF